MVLDGQCSRVRTLTRDFIERSPPLQGRIRSSSGLDKDDVVLPGTNKFIEWNNLANAPSYRKNQGNP